MIFSPPESVSEAYPPDPNRLFDVVRERTSQEALKLIAAADYGNAFEENLQALQALADGEPFEGGLPWEPLEVLQLKRWSSPGKAGLEAEACLFATAALNRWSDEHGNHPGWGLDIIGPLTACGLAADTDVKRALIRRLIFDLECMNSPEVAGLTESSPWALALALTVTLASVGEDELAREAGEWFRELHDKVWPLPQEEPFFMADFASVQPEHFRAMSAAALEAQNWPEPTRELLIFFAKPDSAGKAVQRGFRKSMMIASAAALGSVWLLTRKLRRK